MAALISSLGSPALHCHPVSVTNVVSHTRNQSAPSVQIVFKRVGALGGHSVGASGLNQVQESLQRKVVWSRRKGVAVVRSQGVEAEAPVVEKPQAEDSVHKVLIVGAGIAGLSAAVALHRVGVKVHVLEQGSTIRTTGTSLTLWANAWRALDCLGVGDGLREPHVQATGVAMYDQSGKLLKKFELSECPGGPHEVRAVERKLLIEALAAQLPPGSIQFNSRVRAIRREPGDRLKYVELDNGTVLSTKVLVGSDGANSVVGKWMGLPPTRYVGQIGIRGVAEYPNGHGFANFFVQYLGKGDRFGMTPMSDSKMYWFYGFGASTPGPKVTDRNRIKEDVLRIAQNGWPKIVQELVANTPIENISRAALADRWTIPGITPPVISEGVALSGDALHPMTPSLGQGGGSAIEDGVVLAQTLGAVLSQDPDDESIQKALEQYAALRQKRALPLTVKAFVLGVLFAIDFPPIIYFRNNVALPKLVSPTVFLSSTLFDVGKLPASKVTVG